MASTEEGGGVDTSFHYEIHRRRKEICRSMASDQSVRPQFLLLEETNRNIKVTATNSDFGKAYLVQPRPGFCVGGR